MPEEAQKNWDTIKESGAKYEQEWSSLFAEYKKKFPELAAEFERTQAGKLKDGWEKSLPSFPIDKPVATRNAGNVVMNAFAKDVPELIGGAADLTASTKTILKDGGNFHIDPKGRNIWFGVREFGMCAAVNGMAAHAALIPYGSTFFTSAITASLRCAWLQSCTRSRCSSLLTIRLRWAKTGRRTSRSST